MSSLEAPRIAHETLALYNNLREINRYSETCTHWVGEEWPCEGPTRRYAFSTEGAALTWFNSGKVTEHAREVSAEEAAEGCPCRRRAVAMEPASRQDLVVI